MSDFFEIMGRPVLACLILTGIHVYLGLHVLAREVIFADLAMAQVAALGSCLGFFVGLEMHSSESYLISVAVTALIAVLFAIIHTTKKLDIPREAFIGVVYAVAAASTIIVLNFLPEGGEELKAKAVGHLLFVSWDEIQKMFLTYVFVGGIHYLFRQKLWAASLQDRTNSHEGMFIWHYLFYLTLGIVVASSVEVGGVLLVFSILIVPVLCTSIFTQDFRSRLLVGWPLSFIVCSCGALVSYLIDLPTGATIVALFGATLVASVILKKMVLKI